MSAWRTGEPPTTRPILGRWKRPQRYLVGQMAVVQFRPSKQAGSDGPIRLWSSGYFRYPQPDEWREIASDSDGTATAAVCEDIPVPKDCQARAESIAPKSLKSSGSHGSIA